MFTFLRDSIQKHFLKADIQASAFDSFYQQLLESSYPHHSKEVQGHSLPCYNLLSPNESKQLANYLQGLDGPLLDYGCGLSFISPLLEKTVTLHGLDFSQFAIKYNRENFPNHNFKAYHLNLLPQLKPYKYILITDSLYHFDHPLKPILKMISSGSESLYWCHNFKDKNLSLIEDIKLNKESYFPSHTIELTDFTQDFSSLVTQWLDILNSQHVQEERKIYPLIWDTLEKEMKAHKVAFSQKRIKRYHLKFNRI